MTRKKRRGRRQESLPLEPATTGEAGVTPGVAADASVRGERRRRSAAPTSEAVEARVEGLAPNLPAPATATGLQSVPGDAADLAAASDENRAAGLTMAPRHGEPAGLPVTAVVPAGPTESDGCAAPTAASRDPGAPARSIDVGPGDAASIGARLRAAREARGLTRDALAASARIPLSAISHIEGNELAALGAPIYARGFLRSYAKAVGVPEVVADSALRGVPVEEPALVVANPASVGDRFAARYKNPLVYALLTVVVVVPLVFLATPQSPRESAPAFAPLDAELPAINREAAAGEATVEPDRDAPATPPPAPPVMPPAPVMASMAPIAAPMAVTRPAGARILVLRVSEPSWVELTAADGRRLEYAQLQPGTTREYTVDGGADLVVGNVPGVDATLNGRPVDLNAVANGNVARLRVGDAAPATGQ